MIIQLRVDVDRDKVEMEMRQEIIRHENVNNRRFETMLRKWHLELFIDISEMPSDLTKSLSGHRAERSCRILSLSFLEYIYIVK